MRRTHHRATACLLVLALTGCAAPASVSYLTLTTPPQDAIREDAASVTVGPVSLPDYLKRSGLARRDALGALHYSATQLWAEPLDQGIQRTLIETLSDALGDTPVLAFPGLSTREAGHHISVAVRRLEATDTEVVMQASWQILATPAPASVPVRTGSFSRDQALASAGGPAIARAISDLVQALALEIAEAIPARDD